jgi:hypothetical protein
MFVYGVAKRCTSLSMPELAFTRICVIFHLIQYRTANSSRFTTDFQPKLERLATVYYPDLQHVDTCVAVPKNDYWTVSAVSNSVLLRILEVLDLVLSKDTNYPVWRLSQPYSQNYWNFILNRSTAASAHMFLSNSRLRISYHSTALNNVVVK